MHHRIAVSVYRINKIALVNISILAIPCREFFVWTSKTLSEVNSASFRQIAGTARSRKGPLSETNLNSAAHTDKGRRKFPTAIVEVNIGRCWRMDAILAETAYGVFFGRLVVSVASSAPFVRVLAIMIHPSGSEWGIGEGTAKLLSELVFGHARVLDKERLCKVSKVSIGLALDPSIPLPHSVKGLFTLLGFVADDSEPLGIRQVFAGKVNANTLAVPTTAGISKRTANS